MRAALRTFVARLRAVFASRRLDDDVQQEIDGHLDMLAADFERRGMAPGDARREARLAFGGSIQALERHREARGFGPLEGLAQDVRYSWRGLRRTPGFTLTAVVTLALGIGANTTFFGLVDAVVFRPTSMAHLDRVYALTLSSGRMRDLQYPDAQALERTPPASVTSVASVFAPGPYLIQTEGRAEYVLGERVSSGYASVFGLYARAGRWISEDDDRDKGADVVVISDRLWREWFGADPTIVGRASLTFSRAPHRIVGVAPAGFRGVQTGLTPTEIWYPLGHPIVAARQTATPGGSAVLTGRTTGVMTFVKAAPGVSTAQVEGDVRALLVHQPNPDPAGGTLALEPGRDALRLQDLVSLAAGILSFSGLVFFAACANLANMLYARGTGRAGEIAVRLSLGANMGRILQLFLTEAAILALAAASVGLALALGATGAFSAAFPTFRLAGRLGVTLDLSPDYRVFLYAFGAGAGAALFVGLLTAWRASRVPVTRALASTTTGSVVSSRRRGLPLTFVSVQITAAVLLLIGAGLFLENTRPVLDRRVNYDTSVLAAARVIREPPDAGPVDEVAFRERIRALQALSPAEQRRIRDQQHLAYLAQRESFFNDLVTRARALPGVEAAAVADTLPGGTAPSPQWGKSILQAAVAPAHATGLPRRLDGSWVFASPGFLDTINLRMIRGRGIQSTDVDGAPLVAVLSASAAEGLWPGEDPIGKTIGCCRRIGQSISVVGVSEDPASSSDASPWTRYANFVFLPAAQGADVERFIVVRARNPVGQTDALRAMIHGLDPRAPIFDAGPLDEFLLAGVAVQRAERALTMSLGLLALGIAMLGVYAVVSYFVSRRTREFGLRLALGAAPRQILKLVIDYSIHIILIGLLPGVLLASLGTRLFEHQLFGIMPNGITMWVAAPLLMLAAGIAAGVVPARRAARVDPNVALKDF